MNFLSLVVIFSSIDQLSKYLIISNLSYGQVVPINSWLNLVYYKNSGFIFGLFSNYNSDYIFIFHFIIFILATYLILKIYYDDKSLKLISSLLLAGAIGNSFDRFFLNGVVDFIDIYYKDFHWPAFNFADLFISLGIILFLSESLRRLNIVYRNS